MLPPPPEKGAFKIETNTDGVVIATLMKGEKIDVTLSHAYEPHTNNGSQ